MKLPTIYISILRILISLILCFPLLLSSQSVSINTTGTAADQSAILDISTTTKGVLLPRMTAAEKLAIASPATGLLIFQIDATSGFYYYDGSIWVIIGGTTISTPSLTTVSTSSITETTAISGGVITSDGGASVTSYGACWDTGPNPTTANNLTNDGTGTGSFASNITGLSAATTYYIRAYAINSQGTSYGNEESFTTSSAPSVSVGDSYQGGTVFYILQNGDAGYDANVQHGLIVSTVDLNGSHNDTEYGCKGTLMGTTATAIGSGEANTIAILAVCSTPGIAAKLCDDYSAGGYSDWYLPSHDEVQELYNNRASVGLTTNNHYYSSTEHDAAKAYHLHFNDNNMHLDGKDKTKNVRAIRGF